jgi:protein-disulfide isomerase
MRRLTLDNAVLLVMALCAVTVTAIVVRREFFPRAVTGIPDNSTVADWQSLRSAGNAAGPMDAKAVMIVFVDFQCPFCRKYSLVVDSVRRAYPDLRIVERNFPLTNIHPQALHAALAAECAASVGKYWDMRTAMFENPALVELEAWGDLAGKSRIADTLSLTLCVSSGKTRSRVAADEAAARRIEAIGTPTVVINDVKFGLPPTLDQIGTTISTISRRK